MTDSFVPDRPVICPYNDNHSIARSRLQRHIIKCSKNYPPDYRHSCPYNDTHRLPKSEIQKHIDDCPDRRHLDPIIYEGLSSRGSVMSYHMENRSIIHCDESWDDEADDTFHDLSSIQSETRDLNSTSRSLLRLNDDEPGFVEPTKPLIKPKAIRPPTGRPEALMIEVSGDSACSDIESVASFMCMGRGKRINNPNDDTMFERIGRGRGCAPTETEI